MTDYRNVRKFKSKEEAEKTKVDAVSAFRVHRWWEKPAADVGVAVKSSAEAIHAASGARRMANLRHARMYENCELDALAGSDYAFSVIRQTVIGAGLVSLNVTAACIDTITAKVAKNRPQPRFIVSGGSWPEQVKGRLLDKFTIGHFYETKAYETAPEVFVDSLEFGTGLAYIGKNADNKLYVERVMPDECYVDDLDGQYRKPRQLFRRRQMQREMLLAEYPDRTEEILAAGNSTQRPGYTTADSADNTVEVWEAWHLPSKKGHDDGRHVKLIDKCVLEDEKWNVDDFPFVVLRFKKRTNGFWGKGVAETVAGIQLELNRLMRSVSEQLRRKGRGRTYLPIGSKIEPAHLTNGIGDVIKYAGSVAPHTDNQNAVSQEEFNQIDRLYQKAFQECGVSELSAAAKKPAGLDAAVALREYSDIESERFALAHQAYEQFFMDYAKLSIKLITKQYGWKQYKVKAPTRRFLLEIDWARIDLEEDAFVMQMFPVSSLPQTPSARYQRVQEMLQDGMIDKAVAQRLLDYPDLESETNLANAIIDDADATISKILDDEDPELMPLEPYQNLDMIISRANSAYLYARHHKCEEFRLQMLRDLIDSATAQKAMLVAPPAPPMAGPPGAGMPPPGPPGMGNIGANVGAINVNAQAPVAPAVPPAVMQ